tara:strand:- start:4138 stop:4626 length:489 start_codon:yes stop_codon:yes gene_type:complete
MRSHVYVGIGSNVNDPVKNVDLAVKKLANEFSLKRKSYLYKSKPVGFTSQPPFINAVCEIYTKLNYWEFLSELNNIEDEMGRTRTFKNAPRVIDLDILIWSNVTISTPNLKIPHPEILNRGFVLKPLQELILGNRDFKMLDPKFINICENLSPESVPVCLYR